MSGLLATNRRRAPSLVFIPALFITKKKLKVETTLIPTRWRMIEQII